MAVGCVVGAQPDKKCTQVLRGRLVDFSVTGVLQRDTEVVFVVAERPARVSWVAWRDFVLGSLVRLDEPTCRKTQHK